MWSKSDPSLQPPTASSATPLRETPPQHPPYPGGAGTGPIPLVPALQKPHDPRSGKDTGRARGRMTTAKVRKKPDPSRNADSSRALGIGSRRNKVLLNKGVSLKAVASIRVSQQNWLVPRYGVQRLSIGVGMECSPATLGRGMTHRCGSQAAYRRRNVN